MCDGGQAVRHGIMHQQQNGERDQYGRVDDHRSPHEAKDKQQHASRTHGCRHALWAARRPPICENNPINTGTAARRSVCARVCERGSAASHCCDIIHSGKQQTHTHIHTHTSGFAAAVFLCELLTHSSVA